ncbi:MAG: response regulator [Butyricicoccus sp.]
MDGLEATRRIRAMKRPDARTIPIIAMTANAFAEDRQRAFAAGMDMHMQSRWKARRWWKRWSGLSNPRGNRSRSAERILYKGKSAKNG